MSSKKPCPANDPGNVPWCCFRYSASRGRTKGAGRATEVLPGEALRWEARSVSEILCAFTEDEYRKIIAALP